MKTACLRRLRQLAPLSLLHNFIRPRTRRQLASLLLLAGAWNTPAANVTKLDTTSMAATTANWSAAPAATDVGEFAATPAAATLAALTLGGANLTLGGLLLDNNMTGPLTIASGNTLTLGTAGINMTAANQNATINCTFAPGGTQTWNVQSGRTLTFGSGITASGSTTYSLTINNGYTGTVTLGNYTENFSNDGYLLALLGGTVNLGSLTTARTTSFTTAPTATAPVNASSSGGIYVNGATVSATSITIGVGTKANSSSSLLVAAGSLTTSGALVVGKNIGSSRWNPCQVSGGALTVTDTAVGLQLSPNNGVANFAEFYVSGGTATVGKISYGASGDTLGGTGWVIVKGSGSLYVGSGGIALVGGGSYVANCSLYSGLLGASADWSSSVAMQLSGPVGTPFTIQAADASAVAHNISLNGIISGVGSLTKTGAGTLTLGGANSYAGDTTISAGVLKLGAAGAIPDGAGKGNLAVSGTFDLNSFSETINGLTGAGSVDNSAAGTPTLSVGANDQTSAFGGAVANSAGALAVAKIGLGSVSLTGANTYNGDTTVSGGTLLLGSQPGSTNFTVAASTTLDVSTFGGGLILGSGQLLGGSGTVTGAVTVASGGLLRPGGAGSAGTLSLANSLTVTGATNLFDLGNVNTEGANVNDEVLVAGNLALGGNNYIVLNLLNGSLANGTYKLIKYAGTLTGDTNNLTLVGFTSGTGQTATLSTNIPGEIDLVVTAPSGSANLTWAGDGANNFWDNGTSSNFLNGVAVAVFNTNDIVTFNDASTNQTVNLAGSLIPQAVTVNATNNYVFSGTGKLTSTASLTKTNTGTLTVLTTNDFSGSVNIDAGTVQVGNGTTSGSLGVGVVANNSALIYNLPDDNTVANNISGTGTLTKQSGDTLTLSGANTFSGNVLVQTGTLKLGSATALGTTAGLTVVANGATLDLNGQTIGGELTTITGTGIGGNGALVNNSGSANHGGVAMLAADSTIGGSGNTTLSGTVGGGFNLTKAGSGTLVITGANTNTGKTIITGGTVSVNADAKLGTAPVATVADQVTINGGTLATTATFTGAATRDITIGASGGTIDVASGTTFTYGDIIQGAGTLTKNGAGTLELTQNGIDHTYGGLVLNAGTMAINKSSGLGVGTVLLNGGTIKTDTTAARAPGNNVTLNGGVTLGASGAGPLTFGGNWTITTASPTLTIDTTATTINGVIGQDIAGRAFTKAGSGALTLTATNTFSGGITLSAGALVVSNNNALGAGTLSRSGGVVQLTDGVVVNNTWQQTSTDTTDSQLDVPGTGAFATWTGPINCPNADQFRCAGTGGTLTISNSAMGLGTSIFVVSRGTVNFAGTTALFAGSGLLERPNATGVNSSMTLKDSASMSFGTSASLGGGKASGTMALTLQDNAAITCGTSFDLDGSTTTGAGAASTFNLNGGTLTVNSVAMSLAGGTATLNLNGGVLKANAANASFFPAFAGLTAKVSTGGAKINDNGFAITVAQPLTHDAGLGSTPDGGLLKQGAGTVTLAGANNYTGSTTVSAGTLALNGIGSIANSAVIALPAGAATLDVSAVSGGFTLAAGQAISGIGTVAGAASTAAGAVIAAGNANVGTLSFNSALTLNALSTNTFAVTTTGGASNKVAVAGLLTPNASVVQVTSGTPLLPGTNTLFTYGTVGGSFSPAIVFDVAPVHAAALVDDAAGHINLVVPNQPPTAGNTNYARSAGIASVKISIADLLAANVADADGDAVTLTGVGVSTNGATPTTSGGFIFYSNPNSVDDQFTYTVSDAYGATATGTVTISVVATPVSGQMTGSIAVSGGTAALSFQAIPGYNYVIERTVSLAPEAWVPISTNTAASNGSISASDTFSDLAGPPASAYYRLKWQP